MSSIWLYSLSATLAVSLISLVGVVVLAIKIDFLKKILLILVSFSCGALFGDVFIHLLPEIFQNGYTISSAIAILSGILGFFVLEKIICWRHCHIPTSAGHPHPFVWINLVGDGLHNFIDGVIIAASFLVNIPLGMATTLAVIFHEIPQEIGDFSVLIHGGLKPKKAVWLNFLTACLAILGAVLTIIIGQKLGENINGLLAFTAGGFLYLAGSDLIPELKKETGIRSTINQLLAIAFGISVMIVLKTFG